MMIIIHNYKAGLSRCVPICHGVYMLGYVLSQQKRKCVFHTKSMLPVTSQGVNMTHVFGRKYTLPFLM